MTKLEELKAAYEGCSSEPLSVEPGDIKYGYAEAVRVTPCSDAGCQDNAWWVEAGTINIPDDADKLLGALSTCGYSMEDVDADETGCLVVEACNAAGLFERDTCNVIQIGPKDPYAREYVEPYKTLRAGTDQLLAQGVEITTVE